MSHFFRDILTGTSNLEYEISRVLSLAGVAAYIIYSGFHLFVNGVFNPLEFGGGFGAILLGSGIGTAAKDRAKIEVAK